jgi:hypothetical protein
MRLRRVSVFLVPVLGLGCGFSGERALAAGAPVFAVTATNVTMPSTGNGSSQYTVTAIPSTGTLVVTCQYAGATTTAKIPNCSYGPLVAIPVTAGQTVTGTVYFYPYNSVVPLGQHRTRPGTSHVPAGGLALAGALLLGLGFRRRGWRWLSLCVFAAGALSVAGITACGNSNGMTPGTYPYTISADNEANPMTPLGQGVSTTIYVTVP